MAKKNEEDEFNFDLDEAEAAEEEESDEAFEESGGDELPAIVPGKRGPASTKVKAGVDPRAPMGGRRPAAAQAMPKALVAQPRFQAYRQPSKEGIMNTETGESVIETDWEFKAEVLNRLDEMRDLIGRN
jgi:hypothetical protein